MISQKLSELAYIAVVTGINLDPATTRSCGAADAYVWYG